METKKKQLVFFCMTSALPCLSSQGYAIPSSFPTNHIHRHQGPPSPGPIISHPSQHHWRTLESSLQVPRIPVPCPCSLRGNPLPAWNTSFHMRLIHFSRSNISILRKHGRHWGSYPIGNVPVQVSSQNINISRVSTMPISFWAWHVNNYHSKL